MPTLAALPRTRQDGQRSFSFGSLLLASVIRGDLREPLIVRSAQN